MTYKIKYIINLQVFLLSFFILFSFDRITHIGFAEVVQSAIKGLLFISLIVTGFMFGAKSIRELIINLSLPLSIYILVAIFSFFWSSSFSNTITSLIGLIGISLGSVAVRKHLTFEETIRTIAMGAEIIVIISFFWSFISDLAYEYLQFTYRLAGVTHGPHALALAGVISIFYNLDKLIKCSLKVNIQKSAMSLFIIIIAIYVLVLSDSRQMFFGLLIPVFYLFSVSKKGGKTIKVIKYTTLIFLFISTIIFFYMSNVEVSNLESFSRADSSEIYTFTGRTFIWQAAIDLIFNAPFLGYGYGAGGWVLSNYYSSAYGWTTSSSHNVILHSLLDVGVLGAPFILYWFFVLYRKVIDSQNSFAFYFIAMTFVIMFVERVFAGSVGMNLFFLIMISPYMFNQKFVI